MKEIKEGNYTVWMMDGQDDHMKRLEAFMQEYRGYLFLFGEPDIENYKEMHEKHGLPFNPPTSRVGRYAMTNHGLMYHAYGKYFKLLSNPDDISDEPFNGDVYETRPVSSFDF